MPKINIHKSAIDMSEKRNCSLIGTCPLMENNPPPVEEEKERKKLRASIFFDGTLNNKTNVAHRKDESFIGPRLRDDIGDGTYKKMQGKLRKSFSGSYGNDYSNIVKLEKYIQKGSPGFDEHLVQYIEGIGTTDHQTDDTAGMAFGMGTTGVKGKVSKSLDWIVAGVTKSIQPQKSIIENICLDAFGFSRGAAAARYFIYAALENEKGTIKEKLEAKGYTVLKMEVCFVGLFDTVASFGYDITNDTEELHLDAISKATKVVQLAAADEHREKFPLTNLKIGGGTEIFLPGVHSDIGGGYCQDVNEEKLQILDLDVAWGGKKLKERFEKEKKWLLDKGWYKEHEIHDVNFFNELTVTRMGIKNEYSRIPLRIMKQHATDSMLNFDTVEIEAQDPIPKDATDLCTLRNILGEYGTGKWEGQTELLKKIRHDYFHFSAYYGSTFGSCKPRFTKNDPMKGERERAQHEG